MGEITEAVATGHLPSFSLKNPTVSPASHLLVPMWVGMGKVGEGQGEGEESGDWGTNGTLCP